MGLGAENTPILLATYNFKHQNAVAIYIRLHREDSIHSIFRRHVSTAYQFLDGLNIITRGLKYY